MLAAGEPFLLGRSDRHAVDDERSSRVVEDGIHSEDAQRDSDSLEKNEDGRTPGGERPSLDENHFPREAPRETVPRETRRSSGTAELPGGRAPRR
jgi:hypothetical protein